MPGRATAYSSKPAQVKADGVMKPVLIFRHVNCEGPGYLAEFLALRGISFDLIRIDEGEEPARDIDRCSALVFMGGPMSVNDPLPWLEQELALIRAAHTRGLPILGHCLGGQLISKALGGAITPSRIPEIGWRPVERAGGKEAEGWLDGLPPRFEVLHWHTETFSIPPGAARLLMSDLCENQAFAIGNTLGMQCHIEVTAKMVTQWVNVYQEQLAALSTSVQAPDEITRRLSQRVKALRRIAERFYCRWLEGFSD